MAEKNLWLGKKENICNGFPSANLHFDVLLCPPLDFPCSVNAHLINMYAFKRVCYFEPNWIDQKLSRKCENATVFGDNFVAQAEGINHRKSGRSLTGSRNITVGHASRGHGFIHTPHLSYPPSAFSPVQEEASSTPDTRTRSHTLAQTQWNRAVQRTETFW